ncbi:hypothetical protein EVAR_31285_1 [Eumeta japonica]|uniref:Uncharacterized protein n=1 Tax=Eumeta variegata TaxID=151549 RepID=A0A4C1VRK2_EUMVA|nr:hypothetical protein EVAR_31285_1 [Eumeta japonica]
MKTKDAANRIFSHCRPDGKAKKKGDITAFWMRRSANRPLSIPRPPPAARRLWSFMFPISIQFSERTQKKSTSLITILVTIPIKSRLCGADKRARTKRPSQHKPEGPPTERRRHYHKTLKHLLMFSVPCRIFVMNTGRAGRPHLNNAAASTARDDLAPRGRRAARARDERAPCARLLRTRRWKHHFQEF